MEFETVIGLEVHVQLNTKTKIFAGVPANFGDFPNENICPVTLGLPGSLPVLNKSVLRSAILLGLATNCEISKKSIFARKHYFYPDSPKGYQISQFEEPICERGSLTIKLEDTTRTIGITRIHMEEDAGKSIHDPKNSSSYIDLNRAGTPLLEVVSEPEIRSPKEAVEYVKTLRQLVCWLNISDGNMEEGSLRCDANISLRPKGSLKFGTRTEIKNINSFKFIEKAIIYEVARQHKLIKSGVKIVQETRLYDSDKDVTKSMRGKEGAADYRYLPDPDIPPVIIEDSYLKKIKNELPKLPEDCYLGLVEQNGLSEYDAKIITSEKSYYDLFIETYKTSNNSKSSASWIINEYLAFLNRIDDDDEIQAISGEQLGELILLIDNGVISNKIAKRIFEEMLETGETPKRIVSKLGLEQISDKNELTNIINEILSKNPNQVEQYKTGNTKIIGFFVGKVMQVTSGKAEPKIVNEILKELLS
ncbi:UNVERIFIED_CONTAM: hypothetical protein GTU68_054406 [Idotea baltica]|nr:hypothetical protein [Idotea baltica]